MPLEYQNDDGAQSLDQQQELDFARGWQVVDAAGGSNLVTAGTGSYDVDVAAGDINTPSGTVTCSAATLDLESLVDPDLPRIVIVYRDAAGVAQTLAGTPAAKSPSGGTNPRDMYQPAPDAFGATDGVVLATVLLEAAASSVGSGQIRDRRLPAEINVESATFGSLSTDRIPNAPVLNISSGMTGWRGEIPLRYRAARPLKLIGSYSHQEGDFSLSSFPIFVDSQSRLFQRNFQNSLEFIAKVDPSLEDVWAASNSLGGEWITFHSDGGRSSASDVYVWDDPSDMDDSANALDSQTGIFGPRHGYGMANIWDADAGYQGWSWGTYHDDTEPVKIWRVSNSGTFTQVANTSNVLNDSRHIHTINNDWYNDGHYYISAGDQGSDVQWYETTDHCENWTEITGAGGSQVHRALTAAFVDDGIIWGTDGFVDGKSRLYKASRNDIANPTELAVLDDDMLCYGATLKEGTPYGVVVWMKANSNSVTRDVPVYFYDLESEVLKQMDSIPQDDDYTAAASGADAVEQLPAEPDKQMHVRWLGYGRGQQAAKLGQIPLQCDIGHPIR